MNTVHPIRDPELISDILDYLRPHPRNYILFQTGINTGLRISDILRLRVRDVMGRTHITIREKKTNKEKSIKITPDLKRELSEYIKDREAHEYLFQSRQGINRPIGRSMAYKIMAGIAEEFRLYEIGCHTLRKTFGYWHYKQFKDVVMLMNHFNHSTEKVTLRYIGELQDTMDHAMKSFKIG